MQSHPDRQLDVFSVAVQPLIEPNDLIDAWGRFHDVGPGDPECATLYAGRQGRPTYPYPVPVLVKALPRGASQDVSDQRLKQACHHNHLITFSLGLRVNDLGSDATILTVFRKRILPHDQACAAFDAAIAATWDRVLLDWRKQAPVAIPKVLPDPGGWPVSHPSSRQWGIPFSPWRGGGRKPCGILEERVDVGWHVTDPDVRREVKGPMIRSCRRRGLGQAGTIRRCWGPGPTAPSGWTTLQAADRMRWAKVEPKRAELGHWHGLHQTRYVGLTKMQRCKVSRYLAKKVSGWLSGNCTMNGCYSPATDALDERAMA